MHDREKADFRSLSIQIPKMNPCFGIKDCFDNSYINKKNLKAN